MNILKVEDIKKTYTSRMGTNKVDALKGVFFSVEHAAAIAAMTMTINIFTSRFIPAIRFYSTVTDFARLRG